MTTIPGHPYSSSASYSGADDTHCVSQKNVYAVSKSTIGSKHAPNVIIRHATCGFYYAYYLHIKRTRPLWLNTEQTIDLASHVRAVNKRLKWRDPVIIWRHEDDGTIILSYCDGSCLRKNVHATNFLHPLHIWILTNRWQANTDINKEHKSVTVPLLNIPNSILTFYLFAVALNQFFDIKTGSMEDAGVRY